VQHLIIDDDLHTESLRTIISSCPNVRNLAIHLPFYKGIYWESSYLLPVLREMPHLSRLTLPLLSTYDEFLAQNFLNLTHLEVVLPFTHCIRWCELLTHPTKLTHISVGCGTEVDHILKFLLSPLLKLLILVPYAISPYYRVNMDELFRVDDNRLVLLEEENYDARMLDWERGANGGIDAWGFAELVVLARGSEYFSHSPNFRR
jgi:hypothetical protein